MTTGGAPRRDGKCAHRGHSAGQVRRVSEPTRLAMEIVS